MKTTIVTSFLSVLIFSGCATTGTYTRTGAGWISSFKESQSVGPGKGIKRGESCSHNILGIAATGDASVDAAKRNGNITSVSTVDSDITNIFFLYGKNCTIVTGE